MIAWLIARPAYAAAIALTIALAGWHFQDKISDWWDGRKIERLEATVAAQAGEIAALKEADRKQEAATQAADEARERNDTEIPRIRADTQGRVDRAPTADAATRLQDVTAALQADAAADRAVRGTKPD